MAWDSACFVGRLTAQQNLPFGAIALRLGIGLLWFASTACALAQSAEDLNKQAFAAHQTGRYAEALSLYERALAINEKTLGPTHPVTAQNLNDAGTVLSLLGRDAEAVPLLKRALEIRENSPGPDAPETASTLGNLATAYRMQGHYSQALPLYQRALAISEKVRGPEHPDTALNANNLAGLYRAMGRLSQAIPLYQRSLTINEKSLGPEHPITGAALNNLAAAYRTQGQPDLALPLMERALAIREKAQGPKHPNTANSMNNLGAIYFSLGEFERSAELHRRALAVNEEVLGPAHPETAANLNNLALALRGQSRHDEALPLLERALDAREKSLGAEHPATAESLINLGMTYRLNGQPELALRHYKRALAINESALGPDHPNVARTLELAAELNGRSGTGAATVVSSQEALTAVRRATEIRRTRLAAAGLENTERAQSGARSELLAARSGFVTHVALLAERGDNTSVAESFEVAQLARASDTAAAVAQMASRFAAADDQLAGLIRSRQDLALRQRFLDGELLRSLSRSGQARDPNASTRIRGEITAVEQQLGVVSRELEQRFPEYQSLTQSAPLPLAEAEGLLHPGEALLCYLVGDRESYLWVITRDRGRIVALSIGRRELDDSVRAIRASLDATRTAGQLVTFPAAIAHTLYRTIFEPAVASLGNARRIFLVPDGALQSLPLGVLITKQPVAGTGYRNMAWLAEGYAFSTLPSESSLKALRRFAGDRAGREPFVGFGDPIFSGEPGNKRSLRNLYLSRGLADVDQLRQLSALPDSAREISEMAAALGADRRAVFLRENATESKVKTIEMARFRTIAFATHAFVAGQIDGVVEPALALTPPAAPNEFDDGLLTASEIARLKLNADWVILSACNSASPDGDPAAEGLSGLAKAFIYAGSRTLLVSHWPVDSRAATELTTRMIAELRRLPELSRPEALQRSMSALRQTQKFSHPIYWAPFVVVGL